MSIGAPPTGSPSEMTTPGSLTSLLAGLTALQEAVVSHPLLDGLDELAVYPWRPQSPDLPAIWNWLLPSTSEMRDLSRIRDSFVIQTRIGLRYSDPDERLANVAKYCDAYRAIVDPAYWDGHRTPPATAGYATWGMRSSTQMFSEEFGSVVALGVEFVQTFWLDRHV